MQITNLIRIILDSLYDGVLIIDTNNVVRYINPAYTRITSVTYEQIIGKDLRDVRPGARLTNVLTSGKKILRALRTEDGVEYMVNMAPIIDDGRIIGGISLVKGIDDAYEITEKLRNFEKEIKILEDRIKAFQKAKYSFDHIVAIDTNSSQVRDTAKKIADSDTTVLITGESGTGKELFAQAIHNASSRLNGPFVAVNCASLQSNLLESELFGYHAGAFTGAHKEGKIGLFEAADGGTIFLDEISEMDIQLQSKLLRTLQEGTVRRVGGIKEIPIDVRVIAATNRNLEEEITDKKFREDLFYRIAVFPIHLPPLRERIRDLVPMVDSFKQKYEDKFKHRIDFSEDAIQSLINYDWPGNIRELKNCVEFSVNMMDEYTVQEWHLPKRIQLTRKPARPNVSNLNQLMKSYERKCILETLELFEDSVEGKKKAAESLGISLANLYSKIK